MNDETYLLIDRYLSKTMSPSELKAFEERLSHDVALAQAYKGMAATREVLIEAGRLDLKEKLQAFDVKMKYESSRRRKVIPILIKRALPVAAILIVFFGVYQFMTTAKAITSAQVYGDYFEMYSAPSETRDSNNNETINWSIGVQKYLEKDYYNAHQFFKLAEDEIRLPIRNFYMGMSALGISEYEQALDNFDTVLETDNDYREQARWYRSLTLLKLDRKKEAISTLFTIVDEESFNFEKAKEILAIKLKD